MAEKMASVTKIKKRDGRVVDFDANKISVAIRKASEATGEFGGEEMKRLADIVVSILTGANDPTSPLRLRSGLRGARKSIPTVEQVQDIVEQVLMAASHYKTAKAYILYRQRRTELRQEKGEVPKEVKELASESKQYFRDGRAEFFQTESPFNFLHQVVDKIRRNLLMRRR